MTQKRRTAATRKRRRAAGTRKRRQAQTKTTVVPDRTGSQMSLGLEAGLVVAALRAIGADPARAPVPGVTTDEERSRWMKLRSRPPRAPAGLWLLDFAAAVLAQIPGRIDRPAYRPRDPLVDAVELLAPVMGVTEAARFVVTAEIYAAAQKSAPPLHQTEEQIEAREDEIGVLNYKIEVRTRQVVNAVYQRRRKPD